MAKKKAAEHHKDTLNLWRKEKAKDTADNFE
jgi:hypothetical protein